ncbi:NAD-dependent succinate-semialdehyde dehydrogenase [Aurantimonas sp. C2-6-R+9]|uniref:NAD-dependent succinate-semialdehyde dehydrogenase n=1 Tax=unclassified Aurantimonas TaxID=2638230 RepID=UPI002E17A8B4|nr:MULTISPECIES: NAD-dependent succinate-semialdehyde dehydrogenase [unclassified Aurantimonas]MEC5289012.1 NAD-dependent succinate-semialdehyde dehydrogenase [Aurantimonas sp. C2-3-R2]MEC5379413.1 NAD-dependent succinate-semialdehyde dehydrogenase [Aurantimonas sp. C2-6-R+9]MEC5410166.1 NAD-dependent succinate-semialdehyde dehydrogenase [Aurantimonas sp. C2-4-R8]
MPTSINPATGETIEKFAEHTDQDIDRALANADSAFRDWRTSSYSRRAEVLLRAADELERRKDELARIATREMGKRLKEAVAEVEKCATACRYYAEEGEKLLADDHRSGPAKKNFVAYLPIGPVLAVMPWNFPYWQCFRFAAPAIMAGNVGILKHASNVSQCALEIEKIFLDADAPQGVFQTLLISSGKVERILKDDRIRAATLTGSEGAGSAVAATAGSQIKTTVLELGGSDPFIVMPSADIEKAVDVGVTARMQNSGQSCIAAKRFIVHEDVYEDYLGRYQEKVEAIKLGDPMADDTGMGPLAMKAGVEDIDDQIARSTKAGAKLVTGGSAPEGPGYFFQPSILADVPEAAPAYREELFGPCAIFFKVRSIDAAIALANDSEFGLGGSVWTNEAKEQERFVRDLDQGGTHINRMTASDSRLPFGGVKKSGYGRELSHEGIHAFMNAKTVTID